MNIYAGHATSQFNRRLDEVLGQLAQETLSGQGGNLIAVILGGGYGRGEGGVVKGRLGEEPFNDLDLVIVVRSKSKIDWPSLKAIEKKYADILGIHVDFSRPLTVADIKVWPHWQVWHDLLEGHFVLYGPADIITANAPALVKKPLPIIEASRLLLNRGSGLLWSQRVVKGLEKEPDFGFTRRNYYKAILALGDALLITFGRYTVAYTGRDELVRALSSEEERVAALDLNRLYAEALVFKFTPDEAPEVDLSSPDLAGAVALWSRVFLLVESLRTGRYFADPDQYCRWRGIREADQNRLAEWPRNLARNAQLGRLSPIYPRERLYRKLPVLLGLTSKRATDWAGGVKDYLKIWDRFN